MADALLATNGLVSQRQAGKLRYMDNTEAEQERGITMKSSIAGLIFGSVGTDDTKTTYLINLVDSPGHVDFAFEVSTAVRLCDGAIIVIDVVEGVCPQTRAVLRQAWSERLTLLLVLNKIDRLATEVKLSPLQAYETMCRVIEQVNSVLAELYAADRAKEMELFEASQLNNSRDINWTNGINNTDDSELYFSPDRGNVVFACAYDSWGFRPVDFVDTWTERLGVSRDELLKVIWGDYYLVRSSKDPSRTLFKSEARAARKRPVFVQLILEPIWKAYEALSSGNCSSIITSMAEKLNLKLEKRSLRAASTDNPGLLRALLSTWLPLGRSVMQMVVDICPSPLQAVSADRAVHMLYGDVANQMAPCSLERPVADAIQINQISRSTLDTTYAHSGATLAIQACSAEKDAPTLIFVAKVFWTDKASLAGRTHSHCSVPRPRDQALVDSVAAAGQRAGPTPSDDGTSSSPVPPLPSADTSVGNVEFVALARVFSGTVYAGQKLFVLGPKFNGNKVPAHLLDADPEDFPIGPLRLSDCPDSDGVNLGGTETPPSKSDEVLSTSPAPSSPDARQSHSGSLHGGGGGSSDGGWRSSRPVLRHAYVASIVHVLQFLGGQKDIVEVSVPVPSGNIVGLTGPDLLNFLPKSGLLVNRLSLVAGSRDSDAPVLPLGGLATWHGAPVVSVAVEPASVSDRDDVHRLEQGLRLLDRADPCAEIALTRTGEYLIKAAGEVHLQKCLEDISRYFAPGLELHVSPFVVPFRETIVSTGQPANPRCLASMTSDSYNRALRQLDSLVQQFDLTIHTDAQPDENADTGVPLSDAVPVATSLASSTTQHRRQLAIKTRPARNLAPGQARTSRDLAAFTVDADLPTAELPLGYFLLPHSKTRTRLLLRVTAHPLPDQLIDWVERKGSRKVPQLIKAFKTKSPLYDSLVEQLKRDLSEVCASIIREQASSEDGDNSASIDWSSMPQSLLTLGPNQTGPNMLFTRLRTNCFPLFTAWGEKINLTSPSGTCRTNTSLPLISYAKALLRGFQLATEHGPLCGEPMHGVMFILEEICADDCFLLEVPKPSDGTVCAAEESNADEEEHKPSAAPDVLSGECQQTTSKTEGRKRSSKRLTSISWFDGNQAEEEQDDAFWGNGSMSRDPYDEWLSDSDSDSQNSSELEDSDDGELNLKRDPADELLRIEQHLEDIPFWKRRLDTDWLQDVPPGSLTPAMTRACFAAFQADWVGQRLMLAMYDVELQARPDVLGRMFGVLRRRHGRVVSEDFHEGENVFVINARLPVIESFGLSEELRTRTSGLVSFPQLRPAGWELLDIDLIQKESTSSLANTCPTDPGAVVSTGPVNKDQDGFRGGTHKSGSTVSSCGTSSRSKKSQSGTHGKAGVTNLPAQSEAAVADDDDDAIATELSAHVLRVRHYIREARRRKGLPTNEQLVMFADKQRTLKKNK